MQFLKIKSSNSLLALLSACCICNSPLFAKNHTHHHSSHSSQSYHATTLSLQAIQSNFISAGDPLRDNNGLPIAGLTTQIS